MQPFATQADEGGLETTMVVEAQGAQAPMDEGAAAEAAAVDAKDVRTQRRRRPVFMEMFTATALLSARWLQPSR